MSDDSQELVDDTSTSTKMSNDEIQPVDEITTSKKKDEWAVEVEARLENLDISHATIPSIFGSWQSWDDFGASFVPEYKKWLFIRYMNRWFDLDLRSYLEYMIEQEDLAWSYYHEINEKFRAENGKNFVEHLLVNSCILILAMFMFLKKESLLENLGLHFDEYNEPKDEKARDFDYLLRFIIQDPIQTQRYMLTMGYQIPWFVVEAVYTKYSNLSKLINTPIHKLALSFFKDLCPGMHQSKVNYDTITRTLPSGGFKHLLHIFHWSRTPEGEYLVETKSLQPVKNMDHFYIPSATELQISATAFEKHAGIHVSYYDRKLSGVLQLAPLYPFEYSMDIYRGLLEFERNYAMVGFSVTAYVACMVCLLHTKEDVRLFREIGIIPCTRINNKDVLRQVQEFNNFLRNIPMSNYLNDLSAKVMAHHERSFSRCYAELKRHYCSNPWITISVIAGFLLFVLTFIQTIYGTFSYYKQ